MSKMPFILVESSIQAIVFQEQPHLWNINRIVFGENFLFFRSNIGGGLKHIGLNILLIEIHITCSRRVFSWDDLLN